MLHKWAREMHWPFILAVMGLMALGTLFIYSAAYHDSGTYMSKQPYLVAAGLAAFMIMPLFGYRTFLSISYLLYVIGIILLIWVFIGGEKRLGAQRWINLGLISIQPTEFAKITTVLALANFLGTHHEFERKKSVVFGALAMGMLPFILIAKQPDLGSAIVFLPILGSLLFLWGIRYRTILFTALAGVVAMPIFWTFLKGYQKKRILVFLNPDLDPLGAGYTTVQSKIAIGSGGLLGKGFLSGTQSQLQFVPEHHTDFIFCVIGEEWGFVGTMVLLVMYGFLFRAAFQIMENTTDMKAKLMISGIMAILFSQIFVNIGMSFGLMPVTGITLPLVSYGGSSLLTTALALGLILSVYKERSIF